MSNNIFPPNKPNPINKVKKIRDTAMGFIYIAVSILMLWAQSRGLLEGYDATIIRIVAILAIVYGLFRLYRALIQKK